jgi:hypothetical protein
VRGFLFTYWRNNYLRCTVVLGDKKYSIHIGFPNDPIANLPGLTNLNNAIHQAISHVIAADNFNPYFCRIVSSFFFDRCFAGAAWRTTTFHASHGHPWKAGRIH